MSYWDEIRLGEPFVIGSHLFEADAIRSFAETFDPQRFHLDEAAAKASVLGGLCASGWHTAAVFMRLNVDYRDTAIRAFAAAGAPGPTIGPSPGVTELRWPRPVYAGDTVTFRQVVTDKRISATRQGWGVVESSTTGENQRGETVFSVKGAAFLGTQ